MRNKATNEQIDNVLKLLGAAWKQYPEQRLGQILLNLTRDHTNQTNKYILWEADEEELILKLEDLLLSGV